MTSQPLVSPFSGLRVVELASVLAGPATGRFFAELGATVIKIEHPKSGGDVTRHWKLATENPNLPISAYYASVNQGKQVVFADLGSAAGRQQLEGLLATADILLVNFKPGDAEKLGVAWEELAPVFPHLIYGQITGYGPNDHRTAFDLVLQAETGFMSMNGTPESGPLKMPVALIDLLAAHQLKEGLLVALLQRAKTGRGSCVHVSLFDAAVASLANQASNWLMGGHVAQTQGSLHPNIAPYGETFRCADGRHLVLAVGNDRQFAAMCTALQLTELLTDHRFATNADRVRNRTALAEQLVKQLTKQPSDSLLALFQQHKVPAGRINTVAEVFQLPAAQQLIDHTPLQEGPATAVRTAIFTITETSTNGHT